MTTPLAFTVRWEKVDDQLLRAAIKNHHQGTLAEAEGREGFGAVTLADIVGDEPGPAAAHFGATTRLFARFVYELFVGGAGAVAHPVGFAAKSVLLADGYEPPIAWGGTAYLSVWAEPDGQPVLVPFPPRVPSVLLAADPTATFADSSVAYRALVEETVARVNLIAPTALLLASGDAVRA